MSDSDELALNERLEFLGFDADKKAALQSAKPVIDAAMPRALGVFYDHLENWPQMKAMFGDRESMDRARKAQATHWKNIAEAKFDEDYVRKVLKVGEVHKTIGLEPRWYIAGYAILISNIVQEFVDQHLQSALVGAKRRRELKRQVDAFLRAALMDMELSVSTYASAKNESYAQKMAELTDSFDSRVRGFMEDLNQALGNLAETSERLSSLADKEKQEVESLDNASEQASQSVNTVASSTEQLSNSISEISSQVTKSNEISQQAVAKSTEASNQVKELESSAEKINSVVSLINDIAGQTNLLALNATIEAARAGEAGKGFAVVANEVKNLAGQTSKATSEIGDQIESVKRAIGNTVSVIEEVSGIVQQLNEIASSISSGVEEQSAATQEIARSAQDAAQSTGEVAQTTDSVKQVGEETDTQAKQVQEATETMQAKAQTLRGEVETFLANIKTQ